MMASGAGRFARVDAAMRRRVDAGEVAGVVTLLAHRGELAHCGAHGQGDLLRGTPMREDAIFRIFSNTKPITSLAALMLCEEGAFRLDDPIAGFIPGLASVEVLSDEADGGSRRVPLQRPITIFDLLTHTSGLGYGLDALTPVDALYYDALILRDDEPLADKMPRIAALPLHRQPGLRYTYSVATDILGRLIEVVSGLSLDRFLEQRVFGPLGMTDTAFFVPPEKLDRLATLYTPIEGRLIDIAAVSALAPVFMRGAWVDKSAAPAFLSGGAGLVSTARDYLRFGLMLRNGGLVDGARLVSPQTIDLMTRPHLRAEQFFIPGCSYGLGLTVLVDPQAAGIAATPGAYTAGGAAHTDFWYDPGADLMGVLMTQLASFTPSDIGAEFKALAMQASAG
jgi:CubicO group peptidase (beta-lactamase class C family)